MALRKNELVTMAKVESVIQSVIERRWIHPASVDKCSEYSEGQKEFI